MSDEPQLSSVLGALDREGYAVVEGLLDAQALETARSEVGAALKKTPFGRNDFEGRRTKRVYALFAKLRALDGPATHPLVLAVLDRVLGHYQLNAPAAIEIGPGERAQPLHTDDAIYPLPRPHPEIVMSVMWPLVDFTEANGATCVVPGSHRLRAKPEPDRAISISLRAGSALFYLGSLWHGGGANLTDRPRTGVVLNYAASWLRPIETHLLAVPPAQATDLPERVQELLGYNLRPPFMGYVDGVHPRKLLQNPPHPRSAASDVSENS
ncbi:MAG TPA: phytanoyl-CoA dioxygenase family protein [Myxococcota bacterium]|nr:phytanoyl-CoA dioxygenase family protein [Myxococcota bacterium]